MEQKDYEEAKNVFDYLTKHGPGNSDYWARLGYCYLRLSRSAESVAAYGQAVGLDSHHPNRYYNLALAEQNLEQWEEAIASLNKALELEPKNIKYLQMLAQLYHQIGRADKALEVSRTISRLSGAAADSVSETDADATHPPTSEM